MASTNGLHKIIGLQRAEFAKAAHLQGRILYTQIAIALLGAIAIFIHDDVTTYIMTIITLFLTALWLFLDTQYTRSRTVAEQARRYALIAGGIGRPVTNDETRNLLARFTVNESEGRVHEDKTFYAASSEPGEHRLVEMLEESAFWSTHLLRLSARHSWFKFAAFAVTAMTMLLGILPFLGDQQLLDAAKLVCAVLAVVISKDVFGEALSYTYAFQEVEHVGSRLQKIKASGHPWSDLLLVMNDYNSVVEKAPLFVTGLYQKNKERLNRLWKQDHTE